MQFAFHIEYKGSEYTRGHFSLDNMGLISNIGDVWSAPRWTPVPLHQSRQSLAYLCLNYIASHCVIRGIMGAHRFNTDIMVHNGPITFQVTISPIPGQSLS